MILPVHGLPGSEGDEGTQANRILGVTPLVAGGPLAQPVMEAAPEPESETEAVTVTSLALSFVTVVGLSENASSWGALSSQLLPTTWKPTRSMVGLGFWSTAALPALSVAST